MIRLIKGNKRVIHLTFLYVIHAPAGHIYVLHEDEPLR